MNTFEEKTHTYKINGLPVPSVTQVLYEAGLVDTTFFTPESARRGSFVHSACEMYDRDTLDFDRLDNRLVPYVSAWSRFCKESGVQPVIIEAPYYSAQHGFAGTVDRAWHNGRKLVVADIKSGALPAWLSLQLAGYSILINAHSGMGVELRSNGSYSVRVVKTPELFRARKLFLEALAKVKQQRRQGSGAQNKADNGSTTGDRRNA